MALHTCSLVLGPHDCHETSMLVAFVSADRLYLGGLDSAHTWHTHPSCPQKTLFSTPAPPSPLLPKTAQKCPPTASNACFMTLQTSYVELDRYCCHEVSGGSFPCKRFAVWGPRCAMYVYFAHIMSCSTNACAVKRGQLLQTMPGGHSCLVSS